MNPILAITILASVATPLSGQVRMDRSLELGGASGNEGRVKGLYPSLQPGTVLSAAVETSGAHRYGAPTAGAIWSLTIAALGSGPIPGTALLVKAPVNANGPVLMEVNGSGPYAVLKSSSDTLHSDDIPTGVVLYVVYDGTSFQLINGDQHQRRTCPEDLVMIGDQVCIERNERGASGFLQATLACATQGLRLCSWGEIIAACERRVDLGLSAINNDLEWTTSTANEDNQVRVAGGSTCRLAGATLIAGSAYTYRCCLTR